ncbi:MAG: radical SAM protein [Clostridiales bacterium]|nr:radical SAM protein [Clostridiales bacterium]
MANCFLCPNNCGVDRKLNNGVCGVSDKVKIAKYYLHPFEEPIISGKNGSGTVFFTGCSLKCVFCQNFEVSRNLTGKEISITELANIFKELESLGAENINLVNPTHYTDEIIKAFNIYKPNIPIVYNTHGYEKVETLEKINDYVDVYMPDMKYFSNDISFRYSGKYDYFKNAKKAIEYMLNKPIIFENGLLKSGVLVRHLVLPLNTVDSKKVLDWFATIKDKAYLSLMSQYTPFGKIDSFPELKRKITKREYNTLIDYALSLGIENMFIQEDLSSSEEYIPKWDF